MMTLENNCADLPCITEGSGQSKAGSMAIVRKEKKSDWKTVEQVTYRAFRDGALVGVHGRFINDEVYSTLDREESDKLNAKLAGPMDVDEFIAAWCAWNNKKQ